jgi:translation initiation factor 2 subunit 1
MVKREMPRRGELVISTVTKVNPFSVMLKLDEYNKEGMMHISEVSRRWTRDIKKVVKVGQKMVTYVVNVDPSRGIALSLKRVNKYDAEEKLKAYKRAQKADRMLRVVAKRLKITLDKAYEKIGYTMQKEFEEMFKGFQIASAPEGLKALVEKGIPEDEAKVICDVAKEQMEPKELEMKKIIDIRSFEPDGVNIIKKILEETSKKHGVEIKYISAPEYSLSLETKNAKTGEKKLKQAADEIMAYIISKNGEAVLKGD